MDPRARRARAFELMRRTRTREDAALSADARVAIADGVAAFARETAPLRPERTRGTDEPIELWRELRARLRALP